MNKHNEEEFLEALSNRLDQRVEEIDDSTKDELYIIRKKAINRARIKSASSWRWLKPVPVMALASIVLVVSVSLRVTMTASNSVTPALEDIPWLTASDDLELYNDLEFYQWLETENLNG